MLNHNWQQAFSHVNAAVASLNGAVVSRAVDHAQFDARLTSLSVQPHPKQKMMFIVHAHVTVLGTGAAFDCSTTFDYGIFCACRKSVFTQRADIVQAEIAKAIKRRILITHLGAPDMPRLKSE